MDGAPATEDRPQDLGGAFAARMPDDDRIIVFPSLRAPGAFAGRPTQYVTDAEIAQLVSVALEDALVALGQPNPETCLRLRAYEARAGIRDILAALPRAKARDENVLKEYRKAMVFQNLALELSLNLVDSITRYARIYEREIPAGIA
jgi:hypothetical protein